MRHPVFFPAMLRFLLSLPLLLFLFGGAALPALIDWSRLYAPNLAGAFSLWESRLWRAECVGTLLLMCLHFPIYRRGLVGLCRRRPGADTLVAAGTLSALLLAAAPRVLERTDGLFFSDPLYASAMSAALAFGAIGAEPPSYFQLIALWLAFSACGDLLRARAAALSMRAGGDAEGWDGASVSAIPGRATLLAFLLAGLTGVLWTLLGVSLPFAASFSLFLLLAAAPCALALAEAVPLWLAAAVLEERGAAFQSLRALEPAAAVDTLVIGRTDLLVSGEPRLTDIVPEGITPSALMGLAAAALSGSRHPIANRVAEHAIRLRARYGRIAAFSESPGEGVEALMNGAPIRVGARRWIEAQDVRISAGLLTKDDQLAERGKTVLYISSGGNAKGLIAYEYDFENGAAKAIRTLAEQGVQTILVSGDSARTAKAAAKRLGIAELRRDTRPEEIAQELQLLRTHGKIVALFDRPERGGAAQSQADLAILPVCGGTAQNSAEKTAAPDRPALLLPALSALPFARSLALYTLAAIRQNYRFTFLGSLLALLPASGILFILGGPFPASWLPAAAALPGLSAVLVNAVRLLRQTASFEKSAR